MMDEGDIFGYIGTLEVTELGDLETELHQQHKTIHPFDAIVEDSGQVRITYRELPLQPFYVPTTRGHPVEVSPIVMMPIKWATTDEQRIDRREGLKAQVGGETIGSSRKSMNKMKNRSRKTARENRNGKNTIKRELRAQEGKTTKPHLPNPTNTHHIRKGINPFEFKDVQIRLDAIDQEMKRRMETTQPTRLPDDGYIFIPVDDDETTRKGWANKSGKRSVRILQEWGLAYHLIRTKKDYFSKHVLNLLYILAQRLLLGDGYCEACKTYTSGGDSRSGTSYPHCGIWSHYGRMITGFNGTRLPKDNTNQNVFVIDNIKRFLAVFQRFVVPHLDEMLRLYDPLVWQFQQAIRSRHLAILKQEHEDWPIDFGGAFFCLAVGRGHSKGIHTDKTDNVKSYAFVIPLGEFEGGDIGLPHLETTVPLQTGQVMLFAAAYIPHYVTQVHSGTRYVITAFTDKFSAIRVRDILTACNIEVSTLNFKTD